jgi:hypothetical protein
MWRFVLGTILSALPRRWRSLERAIPWPSAMLSGFAESLLALAALVYWYSRSVATWAANAMESAMRNGPEAQVPAQAIGFSALVLWMSHPLTWCIGFFAVEGMVRFLAAVSTEQVVATLPLVTVDWIYGKLSGRPPEGDSKHLPDAKELVREFISGVKHGVRALRLPKLDDECKDVVDGKELFLEIHASHAKGDWIPPRVVRAGDVYFRLEQARSGEVPRPFIYRLRRLTAGVPGRAVIVYERPDELKDQVPPGAENCAGR